MPGTLMLNDTLKAWLHTQTGTTPGQGFTINDLLAMLDENTGPIVVSASGNRFEIEVSDIGDLQTNGPIP